MPNLNSDQVDNFLNRISQVESAGGTNFNHQTVPSGLQQGQKAIGTYGLMPNTVDEVITRSQNADGYDPTFDKVLAMDPIQKKTYLENNPDVEYKIAHKLAQRVLEKQGGDPEKAAYAWNQGSNLSPEAIEHRGYEDSSYVQKFNKAPELPPANKPPLSVEGTPEEDAVRQYVDPQPSGSVRDQVKALTDKQNAEFVKALKATSASPFDPSYSDQDRAEAMQKLGPLTTGLIQQGPVGGIANQAAEDLEPTVTSGWNKLKGLFQKTQTPEEFVESQSTNPNVQEVLKDPRQYDKAQFRTAQGRANADATAARIQNDRELEELKVGAKHMDEATVVPNVDEDGLTPEQQKLPNDVKDKLRSILSLGKKKNGQ